MEFFTGHDINGDGKNDFYIGRKVKPLNSNDAKALASTFWALFILIAVVLGLTAGANYIFSKFLFNSFNQNQISFEIFNTSRAAMPTISLVGSIVVVGLTICWLCDLFGRSYSVPVVFLFLFFVIGFFLLGLNKIALIIFCTSCVFTFCIIAFEKNRSRKAKAIKQAKAVAKAKKKSIKKSKTEPDKNSISSLPKQKKAYQGITGIEFPENEDLTTRLLREMRFAKEKKRRGE